MTNTDDLTARLMNSTQSMIDEAHARQMADRAAFAASVIPNATPARRLPPRVRITRRKRRAIR